MKLIAIENQKDSIEKTTTAVDLASCLARTVGRVLLVDLDHQSNATKIFPSGEANALIEAFLNPPARLDLNKCVDSRRTGFVYIDQSNSDIGIRPGNHQSLKPHY